MTCSMIMVLKKNNRNRMAVEYRELNKSLKVTIYTLPNVRDVLLKLGREEVFVKP